ncbi:MAG TPA: CsgG/HfaB family protein [Fimbriimonadaceae bacterium]|jgi:curli biogenesis system outer membrane secretion channel CsgG
MKATRFLFTTASILVLCSAVFATDKTLKMRIAVVPLDWSGHDSVANQGVPADFQNGIYEKLTKKLFDTGKFIILERDAMDAMLKEKDIKQDNTGQNQKGKTVPAQAMVQGKVTDFSLNSSGTGGGISVPTPFGGIGGGGSVTTARVGMNVRIFDVDTSELLATEDADKSVEQHNWSISANIGGVFADMNHFDASPLGKATTKAIDEAVDKIVADLAKQPWSASVADWDGTAKEVTINAGSDLGVQEGDGFDIYRVTKVIKDPDTGEILGKKSSKVGSIKIKSVEKKFAVATPIDGSDFQVGDIVKEQK